MQHRPRKRFGQNFLHDPHIIANIVATINPQRGEHVVEIGPGKGALTALLLDRVGQLDVVELDRDLIPLLRENCAHRGDLRIHNVDALRFDFASLATDGRRLRVVGNLPYNISTPLLFHLLNQSQVIQDMHFMLQKEVVDRLAAPPGGGDYGRLSVMVQYHCQVDRLFTVKPGAFTPAPKVDSAVVRLVPHRQRPIDVMDEAMLARVVSLAFNQRRKTIRNSLKTLLTQEEIASASVDPGARAEVLPLATFARLSDAATRKKI